MTLKKELLLLSLILSMPVSADTVGHWRFDSEDAETNSPITATENTSNAGTHDAAIQGGNPLYSSDVPSKQIYDPIADAVLENGFSLNATDPNSKLRVADSEDFNTNFTIELFIKIIDEPNGYNSFIRRQEGGDLRWQIDFDNNKNGLYNGRARSRWDTPAEGISDNTAEKDVDENFNFVVTPQGGNNAPRVFIDTGAKDEAGADVGPQNTGNPVDYIYDAASANPNEAKVTLQGDGVNDDSRWHHIALTFDQESGEVSYFFDYALAQRKTLSDSAENGYTHPAAPIDFGKLVNKQYGLLLDEIRYSNTILSPSDFLRIIAEEVNPATIAHWRMDGPGARDEGAISLITNEVSPLLPATRVAGNPIYSSDVPAPFINDPATNTYLDNEFSFNAKNANARIGASDNPKFNTSFTVEMFFKLIGEPSAYHPFLKRRELNDLQWQIDYDHAKKGSYGRLRSRWDTPAGGIADNNAEKGIDENVNFVVGPTGGANVPLENLIFVDTDSGDGLVTSYDDETDWFLDGDGINDIDEWKHVALTFDEESQEVTFYLNHEFMQSKLLADTEENGYTHPAASVIFGKFNNQTYEMLIDEVRYSEGILDPSLFLKAATWAPSSFEITTFNYNQEENTFTLEWRSEPGVFYSVDRWDDLINDWGELEDALISEGILMNFEDTSLEDGQKKAIYRIRVSDAQ
ncbi:MAG: hypothetical protein OSB44_04700 [Verrucomicrobiales bacterium]|nr:hypothetical protein [Verrucomicrobiales bacterium]